MSAARKLKILKNGTVLAGVMQKSISVNGEPIEITDDQDDGWRTFDEDTGVRSVDISIEGVTKDTLLREAIFSTTTSLLFTDVTVLYPNGDTLSGNFYFNSLEEGGPAGDAVKFSASLQSSGEIVRTAA